jgi:hypothetical protein
MEEFKAQINVWIYLKEESDKKPKKKSPDSSRIFSKKTVSIAHHLWLAYFLIKKRG